MEKENSLKENINLLEKLQQSSSLEKEQILITHIRGEMCQILNVKDESLDTDEVLWHVDSILLISLVSRLSEKIGVQINASDILPIFSQFKIGDLARLIANKMTKKEMIN